MNQTRTFLLFAWLLVAFLLFMEWSKTTTVAPPVVKQEVTSPTAVVANQTSALPAAPSVTGSATALPSIANSDGVSTQPTQTISIQSDVLKLQIDPRGVSLVSTELLK